MQIINVGRIGSITIPPWNKFETQAGDSLVYCSYQMVVNGNYLPRTGELQPIVDDCHTEHLFRVSEVVHVPIGKINMINDLAMVILNMWGNRDACKNSLALDNWTDRVFNTIGNCHRQYQSFKLVSKSTKMPADWIDGNTTASSHPADPICSHDI